MYSKSINKSYGFHLVLISISYYTCFSLTIFLVMVFGNSESYHIDKSRCIPVALGKIMTVISIF